MKEKKSKKEKVKTNKTFYKLLKENSDNDKHVRDILRESLTPSSTRLN
jgi:hypothetical protein